MRSGLILIIILCLITASCKKEKTSATRFLIDIPEVLTGKWNWISSSGGIGGGTSTPQSSGEIKRLEIGSDNSLKYYVNELLKADHAFTLEKSKSITGNDSALIGNLLYSRQSITFRTADTLILFDECYDCYEHHFVRIK